jgi:hypothetical protein
MCEMLSEACPAIDFEQQIRNSNLRQQRVGFGDKGLGLPPGSYCAEA